jgi:hypothetical protein
LGHLGRSLLAIFVIYGETAVQIAC